MEESRDKIRLRLEYENVWGSVYTMETKTSYYDEGDVLSFIGQQVNLLLKQAGYSRMDDYIFMEDVSYDERLALASYLWEMRNPEKGEGE